MRPTTHRAVPGFGDQTAALYRDDPIVPLPTGLHRRDLSATQPFTFDRSRYHASFDLHRAGICRARRLLSDSGYAAAFFDG